MDYKQFIYFILHFYLILSLVEASSLNKQTSDRTVVTVIPYSGSDIETLEELLKDDKIEFWNRPRNVREKVSMVIDTTDLGRVSGLLDSLQGPVVFKPISEVVGRFKGKSGNRSFSLDQYNSHDQMNNYVREKESSCDVCSIRNIGETTEGRQMLVLKIGDFSDSSKRGVWIDAGIHAREWVASASALFFIDQITSGIEDEDPDLLELLETYNFYILPSANPDGYEYSRTTDRLWRKTVSGDKNDVYGCFGVDPNRNWDFHWNEIGASDHPCSYIYAGPEPFSEPETRNIADYVWEERGEIEVFLTIHSYGQYWLTPWGYTNHFPKDYDDLKEAADAAVEELETLYGTEYTVGTSTNVLYSAAGGSDDWAKGVAGIKYSYTLELRDKDRSGEYYGFLLPPEQIRPTGEETWAGIKALLHKITEIEGRNSSTK